VFFSRTPSRRRLRLKAYEDILAEIERLAQGHRLLGRWTLAQICDHLAGTQEFSIRGGEPTIRTSALFRATIGRVALAALLWYGYIPERQGPVPPPRSGNLDEGMERLRETIRAVSSQRLRAAHPIFGHLTADQWRRFHLHHAAHHLSFVLPAPHGLKPVARALAGWAL